MIYIWPHDDPVQSLASRSFQVIPGERGVDGSGRVIINESYLLVPGDSGLGKAQGIKEQCVVNRDHTDKPVVGSDSAYGRLESYSRLNHPSTLFR